ncbi:MAG TPA: hypothetical protein VKG79_08465 [Bryobacteraceae bacterium]|nr:hypothetical protein [Bryobacteraceae bacterium]
MNQGIAFARTLRALDADDFRASKLGLALAVILLGAWTWWMLAARIPQYETTAHVRIEQGRAIAYFPSTNQLRAGQRAFVKLGSETFSARVQTVAADDAELVFTNNQQPTTTSSSASADIETTRVSPAAIALRTLTRGNR